MYVPAQFIENHYYYIQARNEYLTELNLANDLN